jgi:hypothetical protein
MEQFIWALVTAGVAIALVPGRSGRGTVRVVPAVIRSGRYEGRR